MGNITVDEKIIDLSTISKTYDNKMILELENFVKKIKDINPEFVAIISFISKSEKLKDGIIINTPCAVIGNVRQNNKIAVAKSLITGYKSFIESI